MADDREEQRDELEALESIYVEEVLEVIKDPDSSSGQLRSIEFYIEVEIPDATIDLVIGDAAERVTLEVLPPVWFMCNLPIDYPSTNPPKFKLSCQWLSNQQCNRISQELLELFCPEQVVLFEWISWIKENLFEALDITNELCINVEKLQSDSDSEEVHEDACAATASIEEAQEQDRLALQGRIHSLVGYNQEIKFKRFKEGMHSCQICFDDVLGKDLILLPGCAHYYCKTCMEGYCNVHVKDGTIQQLTCPDTSCKEPLTPGSFRGVLSEETIERWERLLFQQTLDNMTDIEYCPRCEGVVVAEKETDFGQCPNCYYAFCTLCRMEYHPSSSMCMTTEERLKLLEARLSSRNEGLILSSKARSEASRKEDLVRTEIEGLKTVLKNSKPCPKCRRAIQKIDGCNKMTCGCGAYFCWLCGRSIQGYDHFSGGYCALFELPDEVRQEQRFAPAALARAMGRHHQAVQRCPNCGQRNVKEAMNNHMRCWSCAKHFCFLCRQLVKSTAQHFSAAKPCKQHS